MVLGKLNKFGKRYLPEDPRVVLQQLSIHCAIVGLVLPEFVHLSRQTRLGRKVEIFLLEAFFGLLRVVQNVELDAGTRKLALERVVSFDPE